MQIKQHPSQLGKYVVQDRSGCVFIGTIPECREYIRTREVKTAIRAATALRIGMTEAGNISGCRWRPGHSKRVYEYSGQESA
jgi:hypothetical protein